MENPENWPAKHDRPGETMVRMWFVHVYAAIREHEAVDEMIACPSVMDIPKSSKALKKAIHSELVNQDGHSGMTMSCTYMVVRQQFIDEKKK